MDKKQISRYYINKQAEKNHVFKVRHDGYTKNSSIEKYLNDNKIEYRYNFETLEIKLLNKWYKLLNILNYRTNEIICFIEFKNDKVLFPFMAGFDANVEEYFYSREFKYISMFCYENNYSTIDLLGINNTIELKQEIEKFKKDMQKNKNDLAYIKFS